MRKSFDGLSGLISKSFSSTPVSGDVFIFVNRRRDKIKLFHWQGAGFTLYSKGWKTALLRCRHMVSKYSA